MDSLGGIHPNRAMSSPPKKRKAKAPDLSNKPLYIGQWLARLGRRPREVCKGAGVDEGYMSQLISGEKDNPSAEMLRRISEELGISMNDLYKMPPEMDIAPGTHEMRPDQLATLGEILEIMKTAQKKR